MLGSSSSRGMGHGLPEETWTGEVTIQSSRCSCGAEVSSAEGTIQRTSNSRRGTLISRTPHTSTAHPPGWKFHQQNPPYKQGASSVSQDLSSRLSPRIPGCSTLQQKNCAPAPLLYGRQQKKYVQDFTRVKNTYPRV